MKLSHLFLTCVLLFASCKSWQRPRQGNLISKKDKTYIVVANGCYRSCWTSVFDIETGSVDQVAEGSCVGKYKKNDKVKGYEYIYELLDYENKKVGTAKRIYLFDLENPAQCQ